MYQLVFGQPSNYKVLFESRNLEEIIRRRQVSGDIVVTVDPTIVSTKKPKTVLQGDSWLFDWEKNDPNCYARRCQRDGWRY